MCIRDRYDVGDVVTVDLWNYGFDGFRAGMRVMGREYFPELSLIHISEPTRPY